MRLPLVALVALVPALAGALTVVGPLAYGLDLLWPVGGAVLPFVVWAVAGALAVNRPYGHREPTTPELRTLRDPVRGALGRMGVSAGRVRLRIVESDRPTAPPATGRTVVVTTYAVGSLRPPCLEAVLAHELSHHVGANAVPVFCHAFLMLPTRALWWVLARIWLPVRRMWRVANAWQTPFGFLVTLLLALVVAAVFAALAVPAALAFVGVALSRAATEHTEFHADASVVAVGLGPALLTALETAIESDHTGADRVERLLALPPLCVRRAQRLRTALARVGPGHRPNAGGGPGRFRPSERGPVW